MTRLRRIPSVSYEALVLAGEESPLRSDVAGLIGVTRRGPCGQPSRVEGPETFARMFGPDAELTTPLAVRGYYENGGEVAWIVRVGSGARARARWDVSSVASRAGLSHVAYRLVATSEGTWGNELAVSARFFVTGSAGSERARVDLLVRSNEEPSEALLGLDPARIVDEVAARSVLVRLEPDGPETAGAPGGPRHFVWPEVRLAHGSWTEPTIHDYLGALERLGDVGEVAIVAAPSVASREAEEWTAFYQAALEQAERGKDRLVLVDVPDEGAELVEERLGSLQPFGVEGATYLPHVRVLADARGTGDRLLTLPPSGHVAGLVSRLDRERGAHHTPANAALLGVYDAGRAREDSEWVALLGARVNLLRCRPSHGMWVWGGRTLAPDYDAGPGREHVAHRRLVHRLVRAIRRVAEPLVFESNGPELWLTLVRAITTVLLEAWRAGALRGARPEEAFEVVCNTKTNPPEQIDQGMCVAEIGIAPAAPMEFIRLVVALRRDGALEVA